MHLPFKGTKHTRTQFEKGTCHTLGSPKNLVFFAGELCPCVDTSTSGPNWWGFSSLSTLDTAGSCIGLGETGRVSGRTVSGARKWGLSGLLWKFSTTSYTRRLQFPRLATTSFTPRGWCLSIAWTLALVFVCNFGESIIFHSEHWNSVHVRLFEYHKAQAADHQVEGFSPAKLKKY